MHRTKHIAVIGGGVCGLTAALRLAEYGFAVELFEAAPSPGGRTRSFLDTSTGEQCDNGPHLLNGAYHATRQLLHDCGASNYVTWQPSLCLPLWDEQRQHFCIAPSPRLPFPLAMLKSVLSLPGHNWRSALAMLRLQFASRHPPANQSVATLLQQCGIPATLIRDMLEPVCLGAMNEAIETANALSFGRVLQESFAAANTACLGWFNAPLQQALIEPLLNKATQSGVQIHTGQRIRSIQAASDHVHVNNTRVDAAVLALPAYARQQLLRDHTACETRAITNVHLWYKHHPGLPAPFIGGIGTLGQWFFDVSAQMGQASSEHSTRHLCAVMSAFDPHDQASLHNTALAEQINQELSRLCDMPMTPIHTRIICEKRATVLVRSHQTTSVHGNIFDASEAPTPGDLPATIEYAVQRGEKVAIDIKKHLDY